MGDGVGEQQSGKTTLLLLLAQPLQVNRSPSFHTDAPLDKEVKEGLLWDTLDLLDLFANDKRKCMDEERRRVKDRLLNKQRSKDSRYSRKEW